LANNAGDIGKTLKDLGSFNTVKNILVAIGTAVAGQGVSAVIECELDGWCASKDATKCSYGVWSVDEWNWRLVRNLLQGIIPAPANLPK